MSLLEQYKSLRERAIQLNQKILDASVDRDRINGAGQLLGILRDDTLVFDSEGEISVLMDFAFYDYLVDGKNAIQIYAEEEGPAEDVERELLEGYRSAYTSLFRIVSTTPSEGSLLLEDLLNEAQTILLMDIGFSQTACRGLLLFTRIIPLSELNMTSGFAFVFPGDKDSYLLSQYKRLRKKIKAENEAIQRFLAFFKLNKTLARRSAGLDWSAGVDAHRSGVS